MLVSLRLAVFALLVQLPVAWAQAGSADLVGEVRDASSAVIAKAQVAATNVSTGVAVSTEATNAGSYLFRNLKPGVYRVTVEAVGFRKAIAESLTLVPGETGRHDFKLEVGSTEEAVEVRGSEQLLNTENGSLGQVISSKSVVDLPLNGRTFISLAALSPGVALPP